MTMTMTMRKRRVGVVIGNRWTGQCSFSGLYIIYALSLAVVASCYVYAFKGKQISICLYVVQYVEEIRAAENTGLVQSFHDIISRGWSLCSSSKKRPYAFE